jgi:hypothetical protein
MAIRLTESEIAEIEKCPEVLRIVANWHDFQQGHADSVGMGTDGDEKRAEELRAEAGRIDAEY